MVWPRSPATANLTPAKDKTNHTNNTSLPYRGNNLAAELSVGMNDPGVSF